MSAKTEKRRPPPAEQLALSATEVGAIFGLSDRHLNERVRVDPAFPRPRRFGKLLRWFRRDIEKYMASAAFAESMVLRKSG